MPPKLHDVGLRLKQDQQLALVDSIYVHGLLSSPGHCHKLFAELRAGFESLPETQLLDAIQSILQVENLQPYFAASKDQRFDVWRMVREQRNRAKKEYPHLKPSERGRIRYPCHARAWCNRNVAF